MDIRDSPILPWKKDSLGFIYNIEMKSIEKELRDTNILPMCIMIADYLGTTNNKDNIYDNKSLNIRHNLPYITMISDYHIVTVHSESISVNYNIDSVVETVFSAECDLLKSDVLLPKVELNGRVFEVSVYEAGEWEKAVKDIYETIPISGTLLNNLRARFSGKFGELPVD
jgi:hypothetical protein